MTARHRKSSDSHMIGQLFTFLLFGVFLLLSLLTVVIGVNGYRNVVGASESVGGIRTSLGYVAGKVRSNASLDGITLAERDGQQYLLLRETREGEDYVTIIYHAEGMLWEQYTREESFSFDDVAGEPLVEVDAFTFAWAADDLLALTATTADGRTQTMHLAMRGTQRGRE